MLEAELYIKNTDRTRKPTLNQEDNASAHYDKNNEKFGQSEEVLHIAGQPDTQTVDGDD